MVDAARAGQRLDNFLLGHLGRVPRSLVYRLVRTGQVRVNGRRAKPMKKLAEGDEVRIPPVAARPRSGPDQVPAERVEELRGRIVHADDDLMVIDKPCGLAVQGGSGVKYSLIDVLECIRTGVKPVHRLDRPTSGLLVVACRRGAAIALQEAFSGREVEKRYLALLDGELAQQTVVVDRPLKKIRDASGQHRMVVADDGQPARTRFDLLAAARGFSLVEVGIETGRTHQIRAHAAFLDRPLAGDERYNPRHAPQGLKRLFLHAHYLRLPWPRDRVFTSALPGELRSVTDSLQLSRHLPRID